MTFAQLDALLDAALRALVHSEGKPPLFFGCGKPRLEKCGLAVGVKPPWFPARRNVHVRYMSCLPSCVHCLDSSRFEAGEERLAVLKSFD